MRSTDKLDTPCGINSLKSVLEIKGDKIYHKDNNKEVKLKTNAGGYITFRANGRTYMEHRVKYAFAKGPIPDYIDHIDGDNKNNSLSNLRLCRQGLNVANARVRSDNTSGYIGVIWHKASNKWQAQTMYGGKRVHIGLFTSKEEAALAYNYKLTELFGHQCTFNKVFKDVRPEFGCD